MEPRFVEPKTLIDELLSQQKSLTAAARFADVHEQNTLPAQARYYRDLIPLAAPKPGEQYAFEVDLDKCSGCKACVTACHSLNGLDEGEVWRSVGSLHGIKDNRAIQRTVTTACHHCADPGCLNGCPVLAYEKDAVTGIVKHLDDQCIGCSYCILKCPYDVPKYSKDRGIVRKCDMCSGRLASGEAPACVQACPNEAIRISIVNRDEMTIQFLPDAPAPDYTRPTTKYRSAEPLPSNLRAADHAEINPSQAHPSLVSFLVLTQMSVGGFFVAMLLGAASKTLATVSLAAGMAGLLTSVTHLGRPLKAWRAFLGVGRSWLSREILIFGMFAPLAIAYTFLFWLPGPPPLRLQQLLAVSLSLTGIGGVLSSVMVYHDTHRKFWRWPGTTIKFIGTTVLLGAAVAGAKVIVPTVAAAKLLWELGERIENSSTEMIRTARLLRTTLRGLFNARVGLLIAGAALVAFGFQIAGLVALIAAEALERHLFFVASSPDRMPGSLR